MKLGLSAFAWTFAFQEADVDLLPFTRECGYDAFEVPMFVPSDLPVAKLRSAFRASGLGCTVCAILPPGINPVSPDAAVREASSQHLAACIETAAEIGATAVGGPVYAPIGYLPPHRPTRDEMEWAADAIRSVTPLLEATGITLAIEPVNRAETFLVRTAQAAAELCAAIGHPQVGVMVDTFHANIEERNVTEAIANLGPQLRHIHMSENHRGTLGTGHIVFLSILQTLKRQQYSGSVMVEGFGMPHAGRTGPGTLWADAGTTPEALARDSYKHLQELMTNL